ncbi:MAG: Stp1/IreP family PP2C-type Ser/Thr phosphatase [Actinomycetota bacterium]
MSKNLRFGASTEIGLVREVNEDSKLHRPPVFAVADGMGGHLAGDVASAIAIDTLKDKVVEDSEALAAAVRDANRAIYDRASSETKLQGMGTTLTAMYAGEDSAQIVHVGDSRAYLFRDERLRRITTDHTVVGRMVAEGKIKAEDADRHPQRNYLERALGIEPNVELDVELLDTQPGDRILLCSDGLFGMIDDAQIEGVLASEPDPQRAAVRLCREAVDAGGRDNVTAVVVDYPPGSDGKVAAAGAKAAPTPVGEKRGPGAVVAEARRTGPSRARKLVVFLFLLAIVAGAGLLAARTAIRRAWYVGASSGRVTVFNGVPGTFAGVDLSHAESRTDLATKDLPEVWRLRLQEGIKASSRSDANVIIKNLRATTTSPAPAPAQSPPAPPGPAP